MNKTGAASARPAPRGLRIEHRIDIAAPATTIWALIADVADWRRWNPLYTHAAGTLGVGDVLQLTVALPGMNPLEAPSMVKWCVPEVGVHYQSANMGGLVLGNRYVEIEPGANGGCTVVNGEIMGGPLGWLIGRMMRAKVHRALQDMTEALKAEAEARR